MPFTYIADYTPDHVGNEKFYKDVAAAPPDLLHVGHDVPFKSPAGATAGFDPWYHRPLSPQQVKDRMERIARYVAGLHEAGVGTVIPYICDQTIFGDHKKRLGFWEFYDHWEDYREFGLGERPLEDPIEWMQRDPSGRLTLRLPLKDLFGELKIALPKELRGEPPLFRYRPCPNNESWRKYLMTVVANIAKCGYDGIFVDNNVINCYNKCCEERFRGYLRERYSESELKERFGFDDPSEVRLGRPRDGLLWVETQRFRAESIRDILSEIKKTGGKERGRFFLVANWGPMAHIDGADKRRRSGHDPGAWAEPCDLIMFEEMHHPGRLGEDVIVDYILQYKYALACGTRAAVLPYVGGNRYSMELAYAEAAAFSGPSSKWAIKAPPSPCRR